MAKHWYILQAYTGKEQFVERSIRKLMERGDEFAEVIFDVRSPIEEVSELKNGKKRMRKKNVLPGYVLIQMDLPEVNWKKVVGQITRHEFVSGFVGSAYNTKPRPVSHDEARQFLVLSGDKQLKGSVQMVYFSEGDTVSIIDGPFKTFMGRVDEVVEDRKKLRVMVGIFGRSTPVEVDYGQVEKI